MPAAQQNHVLTVLQGKRERCALFNVFLGHKPNGETPGSLVSSSDPRLPPSRPKGVNGIPILHHEPKLRDLLALDAIGEGLELAAKALTLSLGEDAHKSDAKRLSTKDVDQLCTYGSAGQFTRPQPKRGNFRFADVIAREEVPARYMPYHVVGKHFHECARIAALLCVMKAANEFCVRMLSGGHHWTNIGMTTWT